MSTQKLTRSGSDSAPTQSDETEHVIPSDDAADQHSGSLSRYPPGTETAEILEGIDQGFVDLDANWQITYVNGKAEQIYGMSRSYLLGKDFWEVFASARGTIYEREYRRTMERRTPTQIEAYDVAVKNWIHVNAQPRSTGGIALYLNQVTEQRSAQMLVTGQKLAFELAASGASLPEVLHILAATAETKSEDCIGTAIFLVNPDGVHLPFTRVLGVPESWTPSLEKMFEIGPQSPSCGRAAYLGQTVIENDIELEPLWIPYFGLARELEIRACWSQPIRLVNGNILGIMAVYHRRPTQAGPSDVDFLRLLSYAAAVLIERYQAEQAVAKANEELYRANTDLEQFAYSASHDLQEPLRGVNIYSELLMRRYGDELSGEAVEFLRHVRNGVTRMQALLQDLLAFLQVTSLDIPTNEVDAGEAFHAAVANLEAVIAEAGAQVTFDSLPSLRIHIVHLQQLFQNLIGNAIKYRSECPPIVHITAERLKNEWLFSVRDNGIGIDPEYKEQIFGLFKRLHSGDQYAGTGVGLAICKRITERYGGRIWVESTLGQGSVFCFALPA